MRAITGIATLHNLEAITSEGELDFKIQNCQKQFGQFDTIEEDSRQGQLYDLLSREAAYNTIFIYQSIWPNLIVNSFRLNCSTYNNFFL